jgi:hypothetical protein
MKNQFLACILLGAFVLSYSMLSAQKEYPLILDHPGIFKLIDWGVYTHYNCGFTKVETTANYQKIIGITDVVRKNPVMIDPKGFDCQTYVFAIQCDSKFGYGISSELRFDFGAWFTDKGQPLVYKIEPPNWKMQVNDLFHFANKGTYGFSTQKPSEKPKEGFNYAKWNSVGAKIRECFFIPGPKEELGNGIDRYGSELIVVYNPERPPYCLPVKFRELAEGLIDYWRLHPDKAQSDMITKMLEDEYAKFSEAERDGWAYNNTYDERSPMLGITPVSGKMPVMRRNPEYWNKKLPRSAIQILTFDRLTDTKRYTREKEEALKYNSGGYHLSRFLEAMDINSFTDLIDK